MLNIINNNTYFNIGKLAITKIRYTHFILIYNSISCWILLL